MYLNTIAIWSNYALVILLVSQVLTFWVLLRKSKRSPVLADLMKSLYFIVLEESEITVSLLSTIYFLLQSFLLTGRKLVMLCYSVKDPTLNYYLGIFSSIDNSADLILASISYSESSVTWTITSTSWGSSPKNYFGGSAKLIEDPIDSGYVEQMHLFVYLFPII